MVKGFVFVAVAVVCAVVGAVEKVTVGAMGFGPTYDAAVQSALKDAVRQVNGSAFRGDTTVRGTSTQETGTSGGVAVENAMATENVTDDFREVLKGVVLGHRVKSCEPDAKGMYKAVLEVDVAKYTLPVSDNRQKVAVAPLKYTLAGFQIGGDTKEFFRPAQLVTEELGSRMTTAIVQSGRFGVLSREDEDALKAEEKVIAESAPVTEMVKIGQRLGADYLLVGTLRNVYVSAATSSTSKLTGIVRRSLSQASLNMTYRVIVVSTAQIAYMETIDVDLSPQELAECRGVPDAAYRTLLDRAAQSAGYAFFTDFGKNVPQAATESAQGGAASSQGGVTIVAPQVNVNVVAPPAKPRGGIRLPGDK